MGGKEKITRYERRCFSTAAWRNGRLLLAIISMVVMMETQTETLFQHVNRSYRITTSKKNNNYKMSVKCSSQIHVKIYASGLNDCN